MGNNELTVHKGELLEMLTNDMIAGSGRCKMRSVMSGLVGYLPSQYFADSTCQLQQPVTPSESLHSMQSAPMMRTASVALSGR